MLLYVNVGISELEIPSKRSLVIYISNCLHNCKNCHTPYLKSNYGDSLKKNFKDIFDLYYNYFDVVCFMGEGKETLEEKNEMINLSQYIHKNNKQVALYSGRNCRIEKWMNNFDYIKIGSYQQDKGPLTEKTTNQRLYKKESAEYKDITYKFWK